VQANSTSQATLATVLKQANVVPVGRLQDVPGLLSRGELDAFASNKAILHDVADQVPGARLLPGAYAIERQCLAIPRGRESALPFLEDFVRQCVRSGLVAGAAERAKLRGVTFGER
jgi:polar amino acid transport system substrate-binding protein